jgi:hypothetical protein
VACSPATPFPAELLSSRIFRPGRHGATRASRVRRTATFAARDVCGLNVPQYCWVVVRFRRRPLALLLAIVVSLLGACSSDKAAITRGTSTNGTGGVTTDTAAGTGAGCAATTAAPDVTARFTFTHAPGKDGVDDVTTASFAHIMAVTATAAAENDGPITVTVTDANGTTIATMDDIAPGGSCSIDHDFAPGDYFVADNHGNGTQFTSFDDGGDTATSAGSSAPSAGSGGQATLTVNGKTYTFTHGGCSDVLDPNQFLFRDPAAPGLDATYFAVTVTDVEGTSTKGGKHAGAVTYQENGKTVVTVSDATLDIADDLSSGTFSGSAFLTNEPVTGSYTC